MSTTFWTPNAPQVSETFECLCVDLETGVADPRCPDCQGTGTTLWDHLEGQLNIAGNNAKALLNLLGLGQVDGELVIEAIPLVRRRIMRLRADQRMRSVAVSGPAIERGLFVNTNQHAAFTTFGRSDDYILRRLDDFDRLLQIAQNTDGPLVWG